MSRPNIVVVTPVKNEEWILDRFLAVTSQFADKIIVLDQSSSDGSLSICRQYTKVVLLENKSKHYDEAERQITLIQAARDLVPEPRIIFALDADEILAANAVRTPGWQTLMRAVPGTVLCFEKPDLYVSPDRCIRFDIPWPLGYVDDGAVHKPKKIHSIRVPMPDYAKRLNLHDVKILHYGLLRQEAQASKMRLYCVLENVLSSRSLLNRRAMYAANKAYTSSGRLEAVEQEWFAEWESLGIDMQTIPSEKYYWQDFEVLRHFEQYGERRFWRDDIWKFDWEACRLFAHSCQVEGISQSVITGPPRSLAVSLPLLDKAANLGRTAKTSIFGKTSPGWL